MGYLRAMSVMKRVLVTLAGLCMFEANPVAGKPMVSLNISASCIACGNTTRCPVRIEGDVLTKTCDESFTKFGASCGIELPQNFLFPMEKFTEAITCDGQRVMTLYAVYVRTDSSMSITHSFYDVDHSESVTIEGPVLHVRRVITVSKGHHLLQ